MIRAILLFLAIAAISIAGAWYADHPGTAVFEWGSWRIEASLAVVAGGFILASILLILIYKFSRWLIGGPGAWSKARENRKRQKGYEALSRGLVAVAAGDGREAKRLAKRTEVLLNDPPLTLLLAAQAAQIDGDDAGAVRHFEAMCERPETEFLGVRGLLAHARRQGHQAEALRLARRAFELKPDTPWVVRELFALETEHAHWDAATQLLSAGERAKTINKDDAKYQRGILHYTEALRAQETGEAARARELAQKATQLAPDFAPAAAMAVTLIAGAGQSRKADKMLLSAWRHNPHPDLSDVALALYASEPGKIDAKKLNGLTSGLEDTTAARLLLAETALVDANYGLARSQLKPILDDNPNRHTCRLMADLADRAHNDAAEMRTWLERAANAPTSAWRCETCGEQHGEWQPNCRDCGSFASLRWEEDAARNRPDLTQHPISIDDATLPEATVLQAQDEVREDAGKSGTKNAATNDTAIAAAKNKNTQVQPK